MRGEDASQYLSWESAGTLCLWSTYNCRPWSFKELCTCLILLLKNGAIDFKYDYSWRFKHVHKSLWDQALILFITSSSASSRHQPATFPPVLPTGWKPMKFQLGEWGNSAVCAIMFFWFDLPGFTCAIQVHFSKQNSAHPCLEETTKIQKARSLAGVSWLQWNYADQWRIWPDMPFQWGSPANRLWFLLLRWNLSKSAAERWIIYPLHNHVD